MIKKAWCIKKDFKQQGVHIDTEKKQIKYDSNKYWLVLESTSILHIYGYAEEKKNPNHLEELGKLRNEFL